MTIIDLCADIATKAHEGQFRHDGTTPYVEHPRAVASKFTQLVPHCVALLHDVIEDCPNCPESKLRELISDKRIIDSVVKLTKQPGQSYLNYILSVREDPVARIVKIEDIKHNMQSMDSGKSGTAKFGSKSRKDKYELALYILEK